MDNLPSYIRASAKQLDYLARLHEELGTINPALYERYSMTKANKEISRLKRRLDKKYKQERQLVLF
jgi:hypothetical protein